MDDEFEFELRIDRLDKAYTIATVALQRARLNLQAARCNPTLTALQIARAEKRCDDLIRRHATLRGMLNQLEAGASAGGAFS